MNKINKTISLLFWFSLALSVGFPLGILGIVFGAVDKIPVLLVSGIVLTVAGFYVMPILWVKYAEKRQDRAILLMIENDGIYKISDLAAQTSYKQDDVTARIQRMIKARQLTGYIFRDGILEPTDPEKKRNVPKKTINCEFCGAQIQIGIDGGVCEYCGCFCENK